MQRWLAVALVAGCLLATGKDAHASGGFLPPLELQYGEAVTSGPDHTRTVESQLLVGLSWASLYPRPTPIDVSFGLIATFDDDAPTTTAGTSAVARETAEDADSNEAVGGYLHVARAIDTLPHLRTWLGVRGELLSTDRGNVFGGAVRSSFELWSGAVATGNGGGIVGTVALGVWAELGIRERADRGVASFAAAGVGIRLPLVAVH